MARSLTSIMKDINAVSEEAAPKDLMAMIFSEFGMGKTVLTMQLAQRIKGEGDILYLDSSDGYVTLEGHPGLTDDTDRMRIKDPADLIVIAKALSTGKLPSKRGKDYTVVVIDEGSSVYDRMLEDYIRESMGLGADDPFPEIEGKQYGPATMAFESLARKFHDIEGVHVIFTAHARTFTDRDGGVEKELRPSFPPGAYKAIMRKLHLCVALSASKKRINGNLEYVRSVQMNPSADVSAKSRITGSPLKAGTDEFVEMVAEWLEGDSFVMDTQYEVEGGAIAAATYVPDDVEHDDEDLPEPAEEPEKSLAKEEMEAALPTPDWDEEARKAELQAMTPPKLRAYIQETYGWDGLDKISKKDIIAGVLDTERPASD